MFTSEPLQRNRVAGTRGAGRATGRDDDGEREEGQQNWDKCTTGADEHLGRNGWVVVSGTALGLGVTDKARRGFSRQEAQSLGKTFPLILVDAQMPEMDGFALSACIKKTPE
jgi:CheY-like chemotaxis protein